MFSNFFPGKKNLYLNDRHEEADTHKEDRRKLYDKRVLPLLEENDFVIFGEKIDPFLWDYYQGLELATIKPENIFYADSYLNYPSLTKAVLADKSLMKKLKQEKFDFVIPYIESFNTEILSKRINASLFRPAHFTDWINNKSNYRNVLKKLRLPVIAGCRTNQIKASKHLQALKKQGFKKIIFKRERSVSGFGTFVGGIEDDFRYRLKDNFRKDENFVVECFIEDVKCSPSIQYFVTNDGISFIVVTDQLLLEKDNVSYTGNIHPSFLSKEADILKIVEKMSKKIYQYLQSKKCFGVVGIDYIVTKQGKVYSTEANVRVNGSTFPTLIVQKLFGKKPNIHWLFKTFYFNKSISFEELFHKFNYFIKKKGGYGIVPVGVDLLKSMNEGQFVIVAPDSNSLHDLCDKFSNLRL
jgi:D-alanine-D-alanine ligase-like ATP-grasp enzyme